MTAERLLRARTVWGSRRRRSAGDTAYLAYCAVLVALVVAVPLARAAWLALLAPETQALLTSGAGERLVAAAATAVWATALLVGRVLGPAVPPPFLAAVLLGSDLPRFRVLARRVVTSLIAVATVLTLAAGATSAALVSTAEWTAARGVLFTAAGLAVGTIGGVLWLLGQVFPRAAGAGGAALLAAGAAGLLWPAVGIVSPAAWAGAAFGEGSAASATAGLAVVAVGLVASVGPALEHLRTDDVVAHARRRAATVDSAAVLDVDRVADLYQAPPTAGRRWRAVRPTLPPALRFLRADLVGAARTPGRFCAAVLGIVVAAGILATTLVDGTGAGLGALAGVILYAAAGPLTGGIRHAAAVSADRSIYGIPDLALLGLHTLLPITLAVVPAVAASAVVGLIAPVGPAAAVVPAAAGAAALIVVGIRTTAALKGPMPISLLTPVSSPFGDPMALIRVAWAVDGILLAAVTGAATSAANRTPALLGAVAGVVALVLAFRWRRRAQ